MSNSNNNAGGGKVGVTIAPNQVRKKFQLILAGDSNIAKQKQDYIDALKIVYKGLEPPEIIEENMKQYLSKESYHARGLESHMVSDLVKTKRMRHRKEVLRQQKVCKTRGDEYTKECNCLFQQSTLHTTMFIKFAERMGQFDEIESLLVNTTTTPATATI